MEINNDSIKNTDLLPESQKPGLWSVSFFAMLLTQFLGAFNDNMFRFLMIPIGIFALQDYLCGLDALPSWAAYVGITSSDPHPYLNRELTARQVIAGAKAARDWLENYKRIPMAAKWRGLLVGYSQGGAVAASTIRYYQEYQLDGLNLIGAICGDGPYNPLETMKQYVKDDKLFMPVSAALFLKGFVDTDADVRVLRRIRRDMKERGRSLDSVIT